MLLEDLLKEFRFNCECRRLSAKTVENDEKQIRYLIEFPLRKMQKNISWISSLDFSLAANIV